MKRRSDFKDLTGQRFNRLLVIGPMPRIGGTYQSIWHVRCDCGVEKFAVTYGALMAGKTQSCGCLRKELASYRGPEKYFKGLKNPLYRTWRAMKQRCYDAKFEAYKNYGGRGISVCQRWLDSFEAFVDDMGERPSDAHSIDRIDNDGNYEPINCRWATIIEQCQNRRASKTLLQIEWNGEELCLKEICRREWVSYQAVRRYLKLGYTVSEAVRRSRGSPFVEDAQAILQDPGFAQHRIDKLREVGKKPSKKLLMANGGLPSNEENEIRKNDIYLRGCMERCKARGITYRGPLPSDYQPPP